VKLTLADIAYVRANYRTLEELCDGRAGRPTRFAS
jgi:hypothetical protein